jgi:outer membrane protein assembly factor BamB
MVVGARVRLAVVVVVAAVGLFIVACDQRGDAGGATAAPATSTSTPPATAAPATAEPTTAEPTTAAAPTTTTTTYPGWVDPASSGRPWGSTVQGMLTFRGNPTRSWYGEGPVPTAPAVLWRFPRRGGMCAESSSEGVTKTWCGTGWTGQANVWARPDATWVLFGAYDRAYHFLDASTGERVLPDLATGDIDKGSATLDPDGFPLYYAGSRDNLLRVVALDRDQPEVLWSLRWDAVSPIKWNSDWDGAPLVLGDYLFEGGENSQLHVVKLNRGYDAQGKVTVAPELVFHAPGWDDQLLADVGDGDVSIEGSVAVSGDTLWFANSGGLVQGWDLSGLRDGVAPTRIFRFWTGDDTDASIVVDDEGYLYVASELQRYNARAEAVGQLLKLDPRTPDDPVVWSMDDQGYKGFEDAAGIWSTPAVVGDVVLTTTNGGRLVALDRATGEVLWQKRLPGPLLSSPVVVDGVLVQGDCGGVLHAYDLRDGRSDPPELWHVALGGCIEATPTVWRGRIYVGTRAGVFYALGDPS